MEGSSSTNQASSEADNQQLVAVLEATLSPNTQVVTEAQTMLEATASTNLEQFLVSLAQVLSNVKYSSVSRAAAGLQLKNRLTSKDPAEKLFKQKAWYGLSPDSKDSIKTLALATLGTESGVKSAAQCVAYIACVEQAYNNWPTLIPKLMENVTSPTTTPQVKEASLESIGYICEELELKFLVHQSNEILTAVIQGMREGQGGADNNDMAAVRLAATKALYHTLDIAKANFEKEGERHFIMQVLCEATQSKDVRVQVAALQNMVRIMSLYYQYMESYMAPALFAITLEAMKSETDEVALQGIEFWSTVCDEEADLAIEAAEAQDNGIPPSQTSRFYVKGAMGYLVPVLLLTLTKQEEFDDEDEWNPCKAAGVCLSLMSGCCEDTILPEILPFVNEHIRSTDWKYRDAAIMALGSVLEGAESDDLSQRVEPFVQPLIELMNDEMVQVRDSVAWTIGRVCEHCPRALLKETYLSPLLQRLLELLTKEVRVAVNACWALSSLIEAAYDAVTSDSSDKIPQTFPLSAHFAVVAAKLLETADRGDSGSGNLRNAAYEGFMDMVKYSPEDTYTVVQEMTKVILDRVSVASAEYIKSSGSTKQMLTETLCLLLAAVQSILRRLKAEDAMAISSVVVTYILTLGEAGGLQEDVMMTMGVLIDVLGQSFSVYCNNFFPVLIKSIGNFSDVQGCLASINIVGDLSRSLGAQIQPLCDQLMQVISILLQSTETDKSLKPPILSVFGDISLAIGLSFAPYLEGVLLVLGQAMQMNYDKTDYEAMEYAYEIRDAVLEAFTGIVQGCLKDTKESDPARNVIFGVLSTNLPLLVTYLVQVAVDDDKSDSNLSNSLGLLGDLCSVFGAKCNINGTSQDALQKLITEGKKARNKRTRYLAEWANKEFKTCLQRQTDAVK